MFLEKGSKGQNYSSSDSHHPIKSPWQNFPFLPTDGEFSHPLILFGKPCGRCNRTKKLLKLLEMSFGLVRNLPLLLRIVFRDSDSLAFKELLIYVLSMFFLYYSLFELSFEIHCKINMLSVDRLFAHHRRKYFWRTAKHFLHFSM